MPFNAKKNIFKFNIITILICISFTLNASNEEKNVNKLYVDAVSLFRSVKNEQKSHINAYKKYSRARNNIEKVISDFPSSKMAVELSSQKVKVSGLTIDEFFDLENKLKTLSLIEKDPLQVYVDYALNKKSKDLTLEKKFREVEKITFSYIESESSLNQAISYLNRSFDLLNSLVDKGQIPSREAIFKKFRLTSTIPMVYEGKTPKKYLSRAVKSLQEIDNISGDLKNSQDSSYEFEESKFFRRYMAISIGFLKNHDKENSRLWAKKAVSRFKAIPVGSRQFYINLIFQNKAILDSLDDPISFMKKEIEEYIKHEEFDSFWSTEFHEALRALSEIDSVKVIDLAIISFNAGVKVAGTRYPKDFEQRLKYQDGIFGDITGLQVYYAKLFVDLNATDIANQLIDGIWKWHNNATDDYDIKKRNSNHIEARLYYSSKNPFLNIYKNTLKRVRDLPSDDIQTMAIMLAKLNKFDDVNHLLRYLNKKEKSLVHSWIIREAVRKGDFHLAIKTAKNAKLTLRRLYYQYLNIVTEILKTKSNNFILTKDLYNLLVLN